MPDQVLPVLARPADSASCLLMAEGVEELMAEAILRCPLLLGTDVLIAPPAEPVGGGVSVSGIGFGFYRICQLGIGLGGGLATSLARRLRF